MSDYKVPFKEIMFVWWIDAYITLDNSPKYEDGSHKHLTISIGVKVDEDEDFIYLSNYYDGVAHKFTDPWTSIPKGMIRQVKHVSTKGLNKCHK